MADKAATTDKLAQNAFTGNFSIGTLTATLAYTNVLTVPTISGTHRYLVIAAFEFGNASGGAYCEFSGAIAKNGTISKQLYTDAFSGCWFLGHMVTGTLDVVTGDVISLGATASVSGRGVGSRSAYAIVDLGKV